jgi:phage tail sheath protein FI
MFYIMDLSGSTVDDVIDHITAKNMDSNYVACYFPDVQIEDKTNNKLVTVPPSVILPAVYAYSDAVSYPWFAPAGFARGGLQIHGVKKAKEKLKKLQRDRLQENRINPIASFTGEGTVVWGQKTLQKAESALDRVNVRRMLISVRKMIAKEATKIVFEPNVSATWDKFINKVEPKLEVIRRNFGIEEFKLILNDSTTTEDMIERNIMYAKLAIKPTRSAEKILLDFFVTNNAAGFDE